MTNPFESERLIYRAVEDDDDEFLTTLASDPIAYMNSAPFLPVPKGKSSAKGTREWITNALLGVVICLPPPAPEAATADSSAAVAGTASSTDTKPDPSKPIPIGQLTLSNSMPNMRHHRNTMIGISIVKPYQAQGYGSEAIKWALNWAFKMAGMHKVQIGAFGYNQGAVRLYERLGFVVEGRKREEIWHNGAFHDIVESAMLENEWRKLYGEG